MRQDVHLPSTALSVGGGNSGLAGLCARAANRADVPGGYCTGNPQMGEGYVWVISYTNPMSVCENAHRFSEIACDAVFSEMLGNTEAAFRNL